MSAGWVAAQVRSRSLASHCLGPAGARELANAGSFEDALGILATSSYGQRVHPGMDLASSEHEVFANVLWNIRVLAGWCPALGASRLRALAGIFELENIRSHLARIEGHPSSTPYDLGTLASVSRFVAPTTLGELRDLLRRSPWGDPGDGDAASVAIALKLSLARRIIDNVPEATEWAETYAALVVSRLLTQDVAVVIDAPSAANVRAVLGARALGATSVEGLREVLPRDVGSVLAGTTGRDDLWLAELRWWTRLGIEALERLQRSGAGPETVVAAIAVQLADAWRVRMALEVAARAGRGIEVLDDVA